MHFTCLSTNIRLFIILKSNIITIFVKVIYRCVNIVLIIHLQMLYGIFIIINYGYKISNYNLKVIIIKYSLLLLFFRMKYFNFVNSI